MVFSEISLISLNKNRFFEKRFLNIFTNIKRKLKFLLNQTESHRIGTNYRPKQSHPQLQTNSKTQSTVSASSKLGKEAKIIYFYIQ